MARKKVILSHPRVIFREGIHFILSGEEDFEVVGETTGYREALELIEAGPPDIVVLGQDDDNTSAAAATRRIKGMCPSTAVVLITDKTDSETIFHSLTSGISAYLPPDTAPERLVDVLREAAQGRLPAAEALLTPALAARALADFKDLATLAGRMGITIAPPSRKEAEILNGIAAGSRIEPLADLSEAAVRDQLRVIVQKLVANDRVRALITEIQKGLPPLIPGLLKGKREPSEYLTRTEFNKFKDSLSTRFKSLVS